MSPGPQESGGRGESLEETLDALCTIPMFEGLKTAELRAIAGFMNCFEVAAGDAVFLEGEPGDYVCFVAEGRLEVSKASPAGGRTAITTLTRGQSIGEMAVIEEAPRSATVLALSGARLVTLSRRDFDALLERHPQIGIGLLKGIARILSRNLRRTSGLLAERTLPLP